MFPLPTWYNINILDKSLVLKRSVRIFVSVSVWTQFCTISWSVIFQLSHLHNADKCLTWMMQSWIHLGQKMCKVVWNPKINMKERCKTFIIECGLAKYKKHVPCYTAVSKIHRKSRILGLFYAGLCMGSYYWWHITDSQEYFNVYRDTFQNKTKQNKQLSNCIQTFCWCFLNTYNINENFMYMLKHDSVPGHWWENTI